MRWSMIAYQAPDPDQSKLCPNTSWVVGYDVIKQASLECAKTNGQCTLPARTQPERLFLSCRRIRPFPTVALRGGTACPHAHTPYTRPYPQLDRRLFDSTRPEIRLTLSWRKLQYANIPHMIIYDFELFD